MRPGILFQTVHAPRGLPRKGAVEQCRGGFLAKSKLSLGLDIGTSMVKVAQLKETKKGYSLQHFAMAPLPPEAIVEGALMNPGAIIDTIKGIVTGNRIKNKDVALSISGHSVIIKKISLPQMTEEELQESIQWEAEQYIPFDINDVNIDVQVLNPHTEGGQMDILLVAAKSDMVNDYSQVVRDAGLTPVCVDVDAFCLQNMFEMAYGFVPGETMALINIGASLININVIASGVTAFTRDIAIGGNQLTDEIQKQLNVSYEEAEAYKLGGEPGVDVDTLIPQEVERVIQQVAEQVALEVQRSLDFYSTTSADGGISKIYVTGGTAKITTMLKVLEQRTGVPVERANPFANILVDAAQFSDDFIREAAPMAAVAIGLGYRGPEL